VDMIQRTSLHILSLVRTTTSRIASPCQSRWLSLTAWGGKTYTEDYAEKRMHIEKNTKDGGERFRKRALSDIVDKYNLDWPSVYDTASSYNPYVMPLNIRMGRPRGKHAHGVPPNDKGNVELLKIPNFFHLTPLAIKRHCEALKPYCLPWPNDIGHRPVRITTINWIYAGPSIRHPDSRFVKLQVHVDELMLNPRAHRKFILLAGHRYNQNTGEVTLIVDQCPTRNQNKEYAYYLLVALYHEAIKHEPWENEVEGICESVVDENVAQVRKELDPNRYAVKKKRSFNNHQKKSNKVAKRTANRTYYRVVGDCVVRYNRVGHPFMIRPRGEKMRLLTDEEMEKAQTEWKNIQHGLPDTSTFDPPYESSYVSEFQ